MVVTEGKATVNIGEGKLTKKLAGFYNPEMKLNRDVAVWIVNKIKPTKILDANAASGIRSLRFFLEAKSEDITATEIKGDSFRLLQKNTENTPIISLNEDANEIMSRENFDYIDIDPFGSPVGFMGNSVKSLNKNGVIALTATDIGTLSGKFVKACIKRYGSRSMPCMFGKEIGVRILLYSAVKKSEEIGKNLMPIFCHVGRHYYRAYLKESSKAAGKIGFILLCRKCLNFKASGSRNGVCCAKIMDYAGPLWLGKLYGKDLFQNFELIPNIVTELDTIGYYDTHYLAKKFKLQKIPKIEAAINNLIKSGFKASKTQFSPNGIKTNANTKDFLAIAFK